MKDAATKQLLRALDGAAYALGKTIKACSDMQGDIAGGLPEAFPVVATRLPVLLRSLIGIENSLKMAAAAGQENPEVREKYGAALQLAEACQKQAGYLQDLFAAVTPVEPGEAIARRLERYREAVEDGEGDRIESVMRDLLEQAVDVAAPLLAGDDALVGELHTALAEVAELKPSLRQGRKDAISMINNGPGSQFLHSGRGNQNHCCGGVQVTGNGATNHFGQGYPAS